MFVCFCCFCRGFAVFLLSDFYFSSHLPSFLCLFVVFLIRGTVPVPLRRTVEFFCILSWLLLFVLAYLMPSHTSSARSARGPLSPILPFSSENVTQFTVCDIRVIFRPLLFSSVSRFQMQPIWFCDGPLGKRSHGPGISCARHPRLCRFCRDCRRCRFRYPT